MNDDRDVVAVIGAGIVGIAIACRLALARWLDDGSALEDPLDDSDELDEPELLKLQEDDPLLDPLDELEHGAQQQQPA